MLNITLIPQSESGGTINVTIRIQNQGMSPVSLVPFLTDSGRLTTRVLEIYPVDSPELFLQSEDNYREIGGIPIVYKGIRWVMSDVISWSFEPGNVYEYVVDLAKEYDIDENGEYILFFSPHLIPESFASPVIFSLSWADNLPKIQPPQFNSKHYQKKTFDTYGIYSSDDNIKSAVKNMRATALRLLKASLAIASLAHGSSRSDQRYMAMHLELRDFINLFPECKASSVTLMEPSMWRSLVNIHEKPVAPLLYIYSDQHTLLCSENMWMYEDLNFILIYYDKITDQNPDDWHSRVLHLCPSLMDRSPYPIESGDYDTQAGLLIGMSYKMDKNLLFPSQDYYIRATCVQHFAEYVGSSYIAHDADNQIVT